jgi:hypothetical protein
MPIDSRERLFAQAARLPPPRVDTSEQQRPQHLPAPFDASPLRRRVGPYGSIAQFAGHACYCRFGS